MAAVLFLVEVVMTSALTALQALARERGLRLSDLIEELKYEVAVKSRLTQECRFAAIRLFGAFFDPNLHETPRPPHMDRPVEMGPDAIAEALNGRR